MMKNIIKVLILGIFLTAFSAMAFAQCDQEVREREYDAFLKYRKGTLEERKMAVAAAKKFLECHPHPNEIADYIKIQVSKMQAQIEKEERANRFNASVQSKNWKEIYAVGKEILANEPDVLDVILVLASIGTVDSTYRAESINYARMAIQKIEAGVTSENHHFSNFSKDGSLAWMNYIIGTLMTNNQKPTKESVSYLYNATTYNSHEKKKPEIYRKIGAWYLDNVLELNKMYESIMFADCEDEARELKAKIKGYAERALDAYARAYSLMKTDAKIPQTEKEEVYKRIKRLYEVRFEKTDGIDAYIETIVKTPFPDPAAEIKPQR